MADLPQVLIVEARFYDGIADELVRGATAELETRGVTYERRAVPGAFEIPAAISFAAKNGDIGRGPSYDGFIALGCVIRGETTHYDYVCSESARGLMTLAIDRLLPIGYGILTVENMDQAWARARVSEKNKGRDAALACLDMIAWKRGAVAS